MRSAALAIALFGAASVAAFWLLGLRLNLSDSQPHGIYRLDASRAADLGDVVVSCVPHADRERAARLLPGGPLRPCDGLAPVMKTVVAVTGDHVSVDGSAVRVNGSPLPDSAPFPNDRAGRPMPIAWRTGHLPAGQVWLAGHTPRSYDSRYFGPVHRAAIRGVATPVWSFSDD